MLQQNFVVGWMLSFFLLHLSNCYNFDTDNGTQMVACNVMDIVESEMVTIKYQMNALRFLALYKKKSDYLFMNALNGVDFRCIS